jgi:DMSO reductase family type II enzyme chaperone
MAPVEPEVSACELARSRAAVYRFLLAALDKPSPAQHAWLRGPEFREALALHAEPFGLSCPPGELVPETFADHESRYLACFEVGLPEPPVVLRASHYNRRVPAPATIHEHVLFYRWFGARLAARNPEPADHLANELAFLIRLDQLASASAAARRSVLRARRDFLARHVTRWTAAAATAADEKGLPPIFGFLFGLLARAVEQDLELTQAALAEEGP